MVGWHHRLTGHEFEQLWESAVDREGWRAAVRGVTESDMTGQLNTKQQPSTGGAGHLLGSQACVFGAGGQAESGW